jgi:co-chaperonin GroES (HSP10)
MSDSKEENTTASGIVLPDDFKPVEAQYTKAKVIGWAEDIRFAEKLDRMSTIIVDRKMVEEIDMPEGKINVILDNYVIGIME